MYYQHSLITNLVGEISLQLTFSQMSTVEMRKGVDSWHVRIDFIVAQSYKYTLSVLCKGSFIVEKSVLIQALKRSTTGFYG